MGKTREASPKAIKYVKNLAKGMTKKDAALDAGYSESSADSAKQAIEDRPSVQSLMKQAGITQDSLIKTLKKGMKATRLYGKSAIVHPDYATRHKYMTTGFRILGVETEKPSAVINNVVVNQNENVEELNTEFNQFIQQKFGTRIDDVPE